MSVPIGGDQDMNAARTVEVGMGVMLEIIGATEETIEGAIREVLGNSRQVPVVTLHAVPASVCSGHGHINTRLVFITVTRRTSRPCPNFSVTSRSLPKNGEFSGPNTS